MWCTLVQLLAVYHASVAEWSIALDCKSSALRATQVRILPGAQNKGVGCVSTPQLLFCSSRQDSKDGGGIQDEQSECLSPSRGSKYL